MKRYALIVCAAMGFVLCSGVARADWGTLTYGGYQPWWNVFAHRPKCMTPEEERLQHFWHDYYHALKNYYCALDKIDWVAYYKNHGYPIGQSGGPCGPCHVNYAPVFVSPTMQWALPGGCMAGGPAMPDGMGCAGMPAGAMGGPGMPAGSMASPGMSGGMPAGAMAGPGMPSGY